MRCCCAVVADVGDGLDAVNDDNGDNAGYDAAADTGDNVVVVMVVVVVVTVVANDDG